MAGNNPKLDMLAQVALSCGDAINSYRLVHEDLSFPEAVEVLAQSPKYKKILPTALEAYTQDGAKIGKTISRFPELDQRMVVARELTDLLEKKKDNAVKAAANLETPGLREQLYAVERVFPKKYEFIPVNPAVRLAVKNAIYRQHKTNDRLLEETPGSQETVSLLELAVDKYDENTYTVMADDVFGLYSELNDKNKVTILQPGIKANDVELTRALRAFAVKYQETGKDEFWCIGMPMFDKHPVTYSYDGNSFTDSVKRLEQLLETGKAAFVEKVIRRINNEIRFFEGEQREDLKDLLYFAEKIKEANLPEEVYTALGTEFDHMSLVSFAQGILQKPVLEKIRKLDKAGPHLGKAAIAYTACHETPEDVQYVAEHILDVAWLGKARPIFKRVMSAGRCGGGAKTLKAFLPEGIDLRKLSDAGKAVVKATGFRRDLENTAIIHEVLRDNVDTLKSMKELPKKRIPSTYNGMDIKEIRHKYEEFLGIT